MSTQQASNEPMRSDQPTSEVDARRQRVAEVRARLAADFGIDTIYVGVPKLSRIIGIAPSTIYGYMRRGEFFMPYRMINTTAMIALDDLAEWHCSSEGIVPVLVRAPTQKPTAQTSTLPSASIVVAPSGTPDDRAKQLLEETLREMGLPRSRAARP